jgi:hypothetical protein
MDNYIVKYIHEYNVGVQVQRNYKQRYLLISKNFKEALKISSYDDTNFRRMVYVRYADSFIIGFRGSLKEVKVFLDKLQNFVKLTFQLDLNVKIINLSKEYGTFLGVRFRLSGVKITKFYSEKCKKVIKRRSNKRLKFYAPLKSIVHKLKVLGFIKNSTIMPQFK